MKVQLCVTIMVIMNTLLYAQWELPARRFTETGTATVVNTWSVSSSLGGMVHVVWCDTRDVNPQIFYKRSTNSGETWEDATRFTETESNAENPGVSIAGVMNPVVHVVWDDDRDENKEIYYKRSSDWGVTWSEDIRLTESPGSSTMPNLHGCVCCGSDVRIVWVEGQDGNSDIYYKYSDDNGLTWSDNIQITDDEFQQDNPNISFCRADVQVVWTDLRNGKEEIWGRHSIDRGITWSPDIRLSQQEHLWAGYPMIAHVDSIYHVVWVAQIDSSEIPHYGVFYRRSNDLGITWDSITRLSLGSTGYWPFLSLAAMKENVHLTWGLIKYGLFYKRSTDYGTTWEHEQCLARAVNCWNPSLAVAGKCVHIVWYEKSEDGTDIYYARDPAGNPVGSPE